MFSLQKTMDAGLASVTVVVSDTVTLVARCIPNGQEISEDDEVWQVAQSEVDSTGLITTLKYANGNAGFAHSATTMRALGYTYYY